MRTGSGLFLLGILTLIQFRELPALMPVGVLALLLTIISIRFRLLRLFVWYLSGFLWAFFIAGDVLRYKLLPDLEGEQPVVHGHVISLPSVSDRYVQFDFQVDELYDNAGTLRDGPGKVRLNWYSPYPEISAGQALKLKVRMRRPHGYMNPHGFDYEAWLFQQKIRATGYVRRNITNQQDADSTFSFHIIRQYLRDILQNVLINTSSKALVLALTIGDQSEITKDQWQVLMATGTGHLLSISGLHIGLVAVFAFFLARWIWPLWPKAACLLPAPRIACLTSLLAATIYAVLAGFTVPVQRSLVMISVFMLPGVTDRRIASADSFAFALLAVLIFDPLAVLSSSFWLSFSAVLIILLVPGAGLPSTKYHALRQWFRIQVFIFIGLFPVLAGWFNQIPLTGLVANAVAIPWVSFISVPLILTGTALLMLYEPVATILLDAGGNSLDMLWPLLGYLANFDQMLVSVAQVSIITPVVTIIGVALLFMPAGMPAKWLGLFWLLPLFFSPPVVPNKGEFEAVILDVGQGLAVVVRTRNHLLLYDTGPGFSSGFNAGWAVIVPFLNSYGINKIDLIVQSHGDNDHIGGLEDVLDNIKVEKVLSSVPAQIDFNAVQACHAGQKWTWDNVDFEILFPDKTDKLSGNNTSCVLRVGNGRHSVLIPGDIEKLAESLLLTRTRSPINTSVLIAPHHGSATSSSPGFIRSVSPDYVIFSAGFLNRYRLPKQDIIERYKQSGIKTLNTADTGAISIQFGINDFTITTEREKSSRFWSFKSPCGDEMEETACLN